MKPIPLVLALSFAVSGTAIAQQQPPTFLWNNSGSVVMIPPPATCPVGMDASQGRGGQLLAARDGRQSPVPGQRIHLRLTIPPDGKSVREAVVSVHGLSARNRIADALVAGEARSDIRRILSVSFAPENDGSIGADLVLPGFTAVTSVRLETINYVNGDTWKQNGHGFCTVAPDPVMRVSER